MSNNMNVIWKKTKGDSVLFTECFGDYGYIFKNGTLWVACTIFYNGDEMDTPCRTKLDAKQVVEQHSNIERGA